MRSLLDIVLIKTSRHGRQKERQWSAIQKAQPDQETTSKMSVRNSVILHV